jgi:hypothetical protein
MVQTGPERAVNQRFFEEGSWMPKRNYEQALRAMQAGVEMELTAEPSRAAPQPLQVQINAGKCDITALVTLLIEKGVITEEEYGKAVTVQMNIEADGYEERLSERYGRTIKLR